MFNNLAAFMATPVIKQKVGEFFTDENRSKLVEIAEQQNKPELVQLYDSFDKNRNDVIELTAVVAPVLLKVWDTIQKTKQFKKVSTNFANDGVEVKRLIELSLEMFEQAKQNKSKH